MKPVSLAKHSSPIRHILLILLISCAIPMYSEVKLPRLISDGMVLQRNTPLKIWGWASPNEAITVVFKQQTYRTTTNTKGNWTVTLPAQKAGGPYTLKVNEREVKNILVGDVFLCSGQSNMELPISRVMSKYKSEIDTVNNPSIRYIKVPLNYSFSHPLDDVVGECNWEEAVPQNIQRFSALGYFFAADLYRKYGVPIGIINTAVGGSPIEAWLSDEALQKYPSYRALADTCRKEGYIDKVRQNDLQVSDLWYAHINEVDPGINRWSAQHVDTSDWDSFHVPGYWSAQHLSKANGAFWVRTNFTLSDNMVGKEAILRLGCIVDRDSTYINGQLVGTVSYRYPPRIYTIPAEVLQSGENSIAIRVINTSDKGGFVEDKTYDLTVDGQSINLAGNWKFKVGATSSPLPPPTFFQYKPLGLYNALIAPLTNYSVKAFVWYQGESNTSRAGEYESLLTSLIQDWRSKRHNAQLPFLYVQLPNFMEAKAHPSQSNWAMLREAQLHTLKTPHTGMAVTIDLGEWNDIHPLNKKDVGHRLSLVAQRVVYAEKSVDLSPVYQSMRVDGDRIILSFEQVNEGFDTSSPLRGFAIAGADQQFEWAEAKIEGNRVIVWNSHIKQPIAVRYAWADNPQGANLRSASGLPASPFRTDSWGK